MAPAQEGGGGRIRSPEGKFQGVVFSMTMELWQACAVTPGQPPKAATSAIRAVVTVEFDPFLLDTLNLVQAPSPPAPPRPVTWARKPRSRLKNSYPLRQRHKLSAYSLENYYRRERICTTRSRWRQRALPAQTPPLGPFIPLETHKTQFQSCYPSL